MGTDTSVRNQNPSAARIADALLKATSGGTATLLVAPINADLTDPGQLGLDAPGFQSLPLAPVVLRKVRATTKENQEARYELLLSASAVLAVAGALALNSPDILFSTSAGVVVAGESFIIESWAASESLGGAYLYRLLLRAAQPQSMRVGS